MTISVLVPSLLSHLWYSWEYHWHSCLSPLPDDSSVPHLSLVLHSSSRPLLPMGWTCSTIWTPPRNCLIQKSSLWFPCLMISFSLVLELVHIDWFLLPAPLFIPGTFCIMSSLIFPGHQAAHNIYGNISQLSKVNFSKILKKRKLSDKESWVTKKVNWIPNKVKEMLHEGDVVLNVCIYQDQESTVQR